MLQYHFGREKTPWSALLLLCYSSVHVQRYSKFKDQPTFNICPVPLICIYVDIVIYIDFFN